MKTLIFLLLILSITHISQAHSHSEMAHMHDDGIDALFSQEISTESGENIENGENEGEFGGVEEMITDLGEVSLVDFQNDPFSQRVLYFGAQWVISQLIGYNIISNSSSWNVSEVIWVDEEVGDGTTYSINAMFANDEGESFRALFVVNTLFSINILEVKSMYYFLGNEEMASVEEEAHHEGAILAGDWVELNAEKAQKDKNIKKLLDEGLKYAIDKGLKEGTLPAGKWRSLFVEKVSMQDVEGTNYRFAVMITDDLDRRAEAEYFVYVDLEGNSHVVAAGFWWISPIYVL